MLAQNLRQLEACRIIVRKDISDLVLHVEYDLAVRTRESLCVLLGHLADWGGLYLEEPRIDEKPSGGQIAIIDSSPTAQIRSVHHRQTLQPKVHKGLPHQETLRPVRHPRGRAAHEDLLLPASFVLSSQA
jgi:hypothetical protein